MASSSKIQSKAPKSPRSKARRAILRLWFDQPTGHPPPEFVLRRLDAVILDATQLLLLERWREMRLERIAKKDVPIAPGAATEEGERWIATAMARLLPALAEFVALAENRINEL